ncbi:MULTISPECIES: flagellar basal body rod protein FlgB [unclassified Herbaspirillum]|uniref:flagellar basal body rod protein FlgB n=1 Tax=unclassified Herbaspirillum TaxID=2624150 RepID=UPI00114ED208|nr:MULTISPECIES: flagellar basal body rod protein FlgB [unclassified Herbaspirillum]MBB5392907.1 flagellar basal-body rod protein FlgB [Herbaspirillum sp. SJZ102]TQK04447.1 flagellar basal-body rod protein FlgB [Herbaspirillum sp. SJZ130]TQK09768.1 flagellar basal-body rod protein FlgB [Herbaspirillum sp. SJZ106]TWC65882.1 flagellar basal-body rod protein FlgB [Herbaspirillum sp. SJZ099]
MVSKLDDYFRFNELALNLRAQRQQVLASNIANADTPNYKARDVNFADALKNALDNKSTALPPLRLARTAAAHVAGEAAGSGEGSIGGSPLLYRTATQGSVDGNTVDMDVERNEFVDNGIRYEAGVTAVNGQIKAMINAIQPG